MNISRTGALVTLALGAAVVALLVLIVAADFSGEGKRFAKATAALKTGAGSNLQLPNASFVENLSGSSQGPIRASMTQTWITNIDDEAIRAPIEKQLLAEGFKAAPAPLLDRDDTRRNLGRWRLRDRVFRLLVGRLPMRVGGRQLTGARTVVFGILSDEPGTP